MKIAISALFFAGALSTSTRAAEDETVKFSTTDFIEQFEALPAQKRTDGALQIAEAWARYDDGVALAWARTLEDPSVRAKALLGVVRGSCLDHPHDLAATIVSLPLQNRSEAADELFGKLGDLDCGRAFEEALAIPDPPYAARMIQLVLERWDGLRPLPVGKLKALSNPNLATIRSGIIRNMGERLAREPGQNPEETLAELPDARDKNAFIGGFAYSVCHVRPLMAFNLLKRVPIAERTRGDIMLLATEAAGIIPQEAMGLAMEALENQDRNSAIVSCFERIASHLPAKAAQWLTDHPDAPHRKELVTSLAKRWAPLDEQAAMKWVATLPEDDRVTALAIISVAPQPFEPRKAALLLAPLVTSAHADDETLSDSCVKIAREWAKSDLPATAAWLTTFAPGLVLEMSVGPLFDQWCQKASDPEPVARWIESLPEGAVRDRITRKFAPYASPYNPALAFKWAARASTLKGKPNYLKAAATAWLESDPAAARTAIGNSHLSEKEKTELLEK